jgi:DMSO/TMAO reductase YedYZ molybdopterin-dependent catalytic subunit
VLVAGAIFELVTGLLNMVQWYPWKFGFRQTHYDVGWITVGALIVHLAVKAPAIARGYRRPAVETTAETAAVAATKVEAPSLAHKPSAVSRRALLTATGAAVGVVTLTTAGQSVSWLRGVDLLAPRDPAVGPQGLPINRTAAEAGVLTSALDPTWRLEVDGPRPFQLTPTQLAALPQYEAVLPIACVEGWSVNGHWGGVRLIDLLDRVGAPPDAVVRITSIEQAGTYRTATMSSEYARDPLTLLALRLGGAPLSIDHGFPARIIAPGRPGVLQTKWVRRIEVL